MGKISYFNQNYNKVIWLTAALSQHAECWKFSKLIKAPFFPFVPVLLQPTLRSYGTHYQVFLSTHVSKTHQGHIAFIKLFSTAFNLLGLPDEWGTLQ